MDGTLSLWPGNHTIPCTAACNVAISLSICQLVCEDLLVVIKRGEITLSNEEARLVSLPGLVVSLLPASG